VIVALCIIFINLSENENPDDADPTTWHFWLINILQFTFGGLLSVFLVFYFRSATLAVSWPFLAILTLAFIANERLKRHYARLTFQISLFFLSILSFAIFIVPVFLHRIGTDIFVISGIASLLVLWLFLRALGFFAREKFKKSKYGLMFWIATIFISVNALYFYNLIPPIPLSLKDAGVYYSLYRNDAGDYVVQTEKKSWLEYFSLHPKFHASQNDTVYAYSAIFSPAEFNTDILHVWQYHEATTDTWVTVDTVELTVSGGRENGFRTYSNQANLFAGEWRVNVETLAGQVIGRFQFPIVPVTTSPVLKTEIKK
jgi:hypothetical protein